MPTLISLPRWSQIVHRLADPIVRRVRFNRWFLNDDERHILQSMQCGSADHPPVFVFQMGKVASTSIFHSLQRNYSGVVCHAHSFGRYHPAPAVRALYRYHQTGHPLKLISTIREPVTRNISAFFQNFKRDTNCSIEQSGFNGLELKQLFLRNYPHEIPLIWLDNNIKKHFDIDVYSRPFPSDGHDLFSRGHVELLLMRHDLENDLKEDLIRNFVGLETFQLNTENVGSDKDYARQYEKLRQAKLPLEHLYYLASSKYMQHFFKREMREIICTWTDEQLPDRKAG